MRTLTQPLNMSPGGIPPVIHVSQYDSDFTIVFTLFSTVGDFILESGTIAMVRGTKSSGTGYSADAAINISAKTVTVTGNQQMTAAAGQNVFEITLYKNNKEISSKNFILLCERAALDMDTIEDKTIARELDNLDQFVADAKAAADRAENASVSLRAIKTALLNCFQHVAWTDEHGQDYCDALEVAFNSKELASITAVFTQGSATIYPDTPLDDLKQYLVVTANYNDSTSAPVTDYTLRGTLAVGTSTITVTYGGKMATFDVVVTDLKNYLTIDDTENIYGFTGLTLTDGDFEYTSAKRYSLVPLKSTIHKVRTLVRSDNSDYSGTVPTWAETACTRIIFNKKSDTEYYATEGDNVYLFTKNASTQAYDATAVSDFATVQRGDRYVASGSTITVSIENGVLTVSDDLGTVMTITNANIIGWWTAEQSAVHVRWEDTEVITQQNWRYITSNDIDFQSGIVGLNVSDGDVEYTDKETTSATSFAVLMLKSSIKHIEFVYKPSGEKSLSRRPPFRIAIAKRGNNFIGCDHTSSYLFTPNASGGEYSATKDTSLSTVTCSDAAFIGIASSGWDGYFNDKTFDIIIENGVLTISGGGYYCTYSNAELIGIWIDGKPCQKLYDVKIYE